MAELTPSTHGSGAWSRSSPPPLAVAEPGGGARPLHSWWRSLAACCLPRRPREATGGRGGLPGSPRDTRRPQKGPTRLDSAGRGRIEPDSVCSGWIETDAAVEISTKGSSVVAANGGRSEARQDDAAVSRRNKCQEILSRWDVCLLLLCLGDPSTHKCHLPNKRTTQKEAHQGPDPPHEARETGPVRTAPDAQSCIPIAAGIVSRARTKGLSIVIYTHTHWPQGETQRKPKTSSTST